MACDLGSHPGGQVGWPGVQLGPVPLGHDQEARVPGLHLHLDVEGERHRQSVEARAEVGATRPARLGDAVTHAAGLAPV